MALANPPNQDGAHLGTGFAAIFCSSGTNPTKEVHLRWRGHLRAKRCSRTVMSSGLSCTRCLLSRVRVAGQYRFNHCPIKICSLPLHSDVFPLLKKWAAVLVLALFEVYLLLQGCQHVSNRFWRTANDITAVGEQRR